MLILEKFNDTWNYTFIIVAVIAITIGTFLTIRKIHKEEEQSNNKRREKRSNAKTSDK